MKRRIGLLFALCMVLALTPTAALAGGPGTAPSEIWVNGSNLLLETDNTLQCGGGTAVYEESSQTLTLSGASITAAYPTQSAGIYANGDLNLVINGRCNITEDGLDSGQTTIGIGILTTGALNLSGGGSLTINAKDAGVQAHSLSLDVASIAATCPYNPFWTNGGAMAISGGEVTAVSTGAFPALWANTNVTITGGKVTATSAGNNGIGARGNLSISGSPDITAEGPLPGLYAGGGISISGGTVRSTATNDSGIFTKGALSISGTANVTATGGLYGGIQADGAIAISGGTVRATSAKDSAIYTPISITVTGAPDITAEGYLRAFQTNELDISGGTIRATSTDDSAITAKARLSITGDANVIAKGKVCALLAENAMILSAKNIEAYSQTNYAVANVANPITIGGKLVAQSEGVYAIYTVGNITADNQADISATGGWGGIQANGTITFNGSKIQAIGQDDDGIYCAGAIQINGGSVYAKGAPGYVGIRAKSIQTAGQPAEPKITLSNLMEKNGGQVACTDWFVSGGETRSWTSFIGKDDDVLQVNMENALQEVWLAVPHTVTYDGDGGDGVPAAEQVFPNGKVAKPTDPTRAGFVFNGWYHDGAPFDFENTAITADITLTANWHAHTYGTAWKSDAASHWHECTADDGAKSSVAAHSAGDWVTDAPATETAAGRRHKSCTVCNYVLVTEDIPALSHTHTYGTDWKSDSSNHWNECACGAHMNLAAHTYGAWSTTQAASATEKGSKQRLCSVCGYVERMEIPAAGRADTPQTGDSNQGLLWILLLLAPIGVSIGSFAIGKKKRHTS